MVGFFADALNISYRIFPLRDIKVNKQTRNIFKVLLCNTLKILI
jgi:hypothetical protein